LFSSSLIYFRHSFIAVVPDLWRLNLTLAALNHLLNRRSTIPCSIFSNFAWLLFSADLMSFALCASVCCLSCSSLPSTRCSSRLRRSMKIVCPCGPLLLWQAIAKASEEDESARFCWLSAGRSENPVLSSCQDKRRG
jgi:hypothetical protein